MSAELEWNGVAGSGTWKWNVVVGFEGPGVASLIGWNNRGKLKWRDSDIIYDYAQLD